MLRPHLSLDDRRNIAEMWEDYAPAAVISLTLAVDPSTVHREIKLGNRDGELDRNKRLGYDPELAQTRFQENLRRRGRKRKEQTHETQNS